MGVAKAERVVWTAEEPLGAVVHQKPDMDSPLCLIIEPTQELVLQTYDNLSRFCSKLSDPKIR